MKIYNVKNIKKYWDNNYELEATFETSDSIFNGVFNLNSTDNAPASKILREMIANGEYEGDVQLIPEPSQEEINTMIEQLKAQLNGNP